jgi:hypothetical protein
MKEERLKELFLKRKISRIGELEIERYINFFQNSYKDDLAHANENVDKFPRWSIVSGYYAMHDIAKLFLVKKFRIKILKEVHSTTIKVMRIVSERKDLVKLLEIGYKEFKKLIEELEIAKKERVKVQYYTGTPYLESLYKKRAKEFLENIVKPFVQKMEKLIE